MIVLITGVIGHGKTQHAMRLMLDYIDENEKRVLKGEEPRQIFTDIAGINTDGVTPLPVTVIDSDFDWRDTPPSSVIFYDECQKKKWIKDSSGALSDDPRVTAMETSRHGQRDIILICQGANYIHSHIRGLVSPHYHCIRPMGAKFTNVFIWSTYQKAPDSPTARNRADDQKVVWLGKKLGQYYKSANEHNEKFVMPLKMKIALFVFVIAILFAVNKLMAYFEQRDERLKDVTQEETVQTSNQPQNNNSHNVLPVSYTPKPPPDFYKQQYLHKQVYEMAYDEDVRPAMVIRKYNSDGSTECRAFNTYGEPLMITDDYCNLMSDRTAFIPRSRQKNKVRSLDKTSNPSVSGLKTETHVPGTES